MTKKIIFLYFLILSLQFLQGCSRHDTYQGYVEGRYRYISVQYPGILEKLFVERGDTVKSGQAIFTLELSPESFENAEAKQLVEQAKAKINDKQAALTLAKITFERQQALYKRKATAKENLDIALKDLKNAEAELQQAQSVLISNTENMHKTKWILTKKQVSAPANAIVFDTYYLPGEFVASGHPILSLLALEDIKVIFFIPEEKRQLLKLKQQIQIRCDNCKNTNNFYIRFISPQAEYTPPVIFSEDLRAKLVYRIEASPFPNQPDHFYPGQPVSVDVKTP